MNKFVYSIFKAILISMIMFMVFDVALYLYRVFTLNQKIESISVSMQSVVSENNYMPKENAIIYSSMLQDLMESYNRDDKFIMAMDWNYKDNVSTDTVLPEITATRILYENNNISESSVDVVSKCMGQPADYGDIQTIQIRVIVRQPFWDFFTGSGDMDGQNVGVEKVNLSDSDMRHTTMLTYTYFVPCLRYNAYTQ